MILFQYPFAFNALFLCLVLAGIYTYFGYHIVRRGVIFVDLSLAQVAALGSSVGVLLGFGENYPLQNYFITFAFTMLGALLFVLFRSKREKIPIEALIGITYAGAIALSLIVLERSASGTEEIKEMLAGSILTVAPKDLFVITMLCAVVGGIHWFVRKPLLLVTENIAAARSQGLKIWWWDFMFYATFGFVVTSSVKLSGVLMVFSFLIIPAVAAAVAVEGTGRRIIFGWIFGLVGCLAGIEISLRLDCSSSPTIVTIFLLLLILTWLVRRGYNYRFETAEVH
jgi:zinc/manganese transport system permease protein